MAHQVNQDDSDQQQGMLNAQAPLPGFGSTGQQAQLFATFNQAALATVLQQQQSQAADSSNKNLNVGLEIKRLQQLHQMGGSGQGALLMGGSSSSDASLLQSMLEQQQKQQEQGGVANPRFENPLVQGMSGIGFNPMLQPAFFQGGADPTFFMNAGNSANLRQTDIPLPSPHSLFHRDGSRRMRGGVIEPFPEKLHRLLTEVEAAGRSDVISFVANGRAFTIHKPDKFFKEIVPLYFRQSRLSSFKRQLNLYGFELINTGPARGGYYHEFFVKDRPELCRRMRRVAVKVSSKHDEKRSGPPPDLLGEEFEEDNKEQEGKSEKEIPKEEIQDGPQAI